MEVDLCGWTLPESRDRVSVEITTASEGPGPSVDAAPGSSEGEQLHITATRFVRSGAQELFALLPAKYSRPGVLRAVFIAAALSCQWGVCSAG